MDFAQHELKKRGSTEKLQELLKEFLTISRDSLLEYNSKQNPEGHQIIYQNLLQRLYISISAIDVLINEFKRNQYYKFPIALQARSCLLDSITILYLILFIDKNDQTRFRSQLARLNLYRATELNRNYLEGQIDLPTFSRYISEFNFDDNFTKDAIPVLTSVKILLPRQMAEEIRKNNQFSWFFEAYKLYDFYSKYEHYGVLSKGFLEMPAEHDFDKLVHSSFHIFYAGYLSLLVMDVKKETIEKMKVLPDRIIEIDPMFDINNYTTKK
ncbi:MAG: hypothetical protein JWO03_1755 [Bacteroidetes bacterium]|nr:hypothetical protein [Bacteroidota bacterium]